MELPSLATIQENLSSKYSKGKEVTMGFFFNENPSFLPQVLLGLLICFVLFLVIKFVTTAVTKIQSVWSGSPWIVKDIKDARHVLNIPQNPKLPGSLPLRRSLNEEAGIEFSYVMWLFVDDWSYKQNQWKHVFHKGNIDSWPNRAPGVWLHPNENKIRVYMNTFKNISEYVDIDNIPISKWINLAVILKDNNVDVYVDGFLKKRLQLSGIPKQNFGDLWVNANGGFSGYVSRMKYYDYAISFAQLDNIVQLGPSLTLPKPSGLNVLPPYLYTGYWTQN